MEIQSIQIQNITVTQLRDLIRETLQESIPVDKSNRKDFLTRKETAEILQVSLVTLNEWSKKGLIQSYKIGGRIRYKNAEIEACLNQVKNLKYRRD